MELGNLCFGNSRGPINFPNRDLVNSKEWKTLLELLGLNFYGIREEEKNINGLIIGEKREISFIVNDETIFEIFPYYWGDCTCGSEEINYDFEKELIKEIFTDEEYEIYSYCDELCEVDCPSWNANTGDINILLPLCTCGTIKKNEEMRAKALEIADKIKEFEDRFNEGFRPHEEECLLLKHNFIYHPGKEDEFWIDWYKYPFRDAFMNKEMSESDIKNIWQDCINLLNEHLQE